MEKVEATFRNIAIPVTRLLTSCSTSVTLVVVVLLVTVKERRETREGHREGQRDKAGSGGGRASSFGKKSKP